MLCSAQNKTHAQNSNRLYSCGAVPISDLALYLMSSSRSRGHLAGPGRRARRTERREILERVLTALELINGRHRSQFGVRAGSDGSRNQCPNAMLYLRWSKHAGGRAAARRGRVGRGPRGGARLLGTKFVGILAWT